MLGSSYYFYGSVHGQWLWLIIISTLVDYSMGLLIERFEVRKWVFVSISAVTNLGILGYFKYCNFFIESMIEFFNVFGVELSYSYLEIILPVGISFYTFQTMSYTFDVAQGKVKARKNLLDFSLYVAFFAQLVAGPIERAQRLLPQFEKQRKFKWEMFRVGAYLVLYGLMKKICIADNIAIYVNSIFSLDHPSFLLIIIGTIAFSFQIYTDFSGYSDIARGIAKILGINLIINFNLPCFASSPSNFWKRWHISLSNFIRDYIYLPMGGNRCENVRHYFNLI
ncbi:MAG: MBOAT family protein, partial [Desulfobacula sp.]|nr:MBOAT family protein [Desulfobacula sp.]